MTNQEFISAYNTHHNLTNTKVERIEQITDWFNKKAFVELCIHNHTLKEVNNPMICGMEFAPPTGLII